MDALKKARAFMKEDGNKVRPWAWGSDLERDGGDAHDVCGHAAGADAAAATTVILLPRPLLLLLLPPNSRTSGFGETLLTRASFP